MTFYDPTVFDVHVLLVDPDLNALFETTTLLQFNSYRVTPVCDPSVASSILLSSDGNATYNLVMVDVNISHLHGFKLLHQAISMDLPVIVMAAGNASPTLAKCAIEDGAFLFMQKPISLDELKYTWQHLWREIGRKNKQKQNTTTNSVSVSVTMNENVSTNMATNVPCVGLMPKLCTEWTPDLHKKFMDAVEQLGEGRCFPKDILEVMNVPGLKRMQVASHLQKFRRQQNPNGLGPNISNAYKKSYGIFPPKDIVQLAPAAINVENRNSVQQQGTIWDMIMTTPSNNNMNENVISGLSMVGVQPELDFDLVANNVNLNEFDYADNSITGQNSDFDASIEDADFWSSWFADVAKEN